MTRLFYLSIPSSLFGFVVDRLGGNGLTEGCTHGSTFSRLMIEKPFGYDLASAEELIGKLSKSFTEEQIYRIDHYLAKETAQNILTFRFDNPLFNSSWNKDHISKITVRATESIGIEGRAEFYEQTGAMRDLIQSHLLQILALVTMERPETMTSADIHAVKETIMSQLQPPHETVLLPLLLPDSPNQRHRPGPNPSARHHSIPGPRQRFQHGA